MNEERTVGNHVVKLLAKNKSSFFFNQLSTKQLFLRLANSHLRCERGFVPHKLFTSNARERAY